jgi:hypothetical protein
MRLIGKRPPSTHGEISSITTREMHREIAPDVRKVFMLDPGCSIPAP